MKYILLISFLVLTLICGCQSKGANRVSENSQVKLTPESDQPLNIDYKKESHLPEMNKDSLWDYLAFQKGGCLTGGQYIRNERFGNEGCVMTRSKDWETFFDRDQQELTHFLISKLTGDTTKTEIHTCPFFAATEGELAVYSLQKMYKINWYDFEEFEEYQIKESVSASDNHQAWLHSILQDDRKRKILINCWTKKSSG